MKVAATLAVFLSTAICQWALAVLPPGAKPTDGQELDLSGFSKLDSKAAPDSPIKMKANCSSRYVGTYNSDERGFDACLSELEHSKFQQNSRNPGDRNQLPTNGPSLEFKSEVEFK